MAKTWMHFERLVAAIHRTADQGAVVTWDDVIQGRQFDVTIRFKKGLYEYLTVIECKDFEKPVPVEKVEAFITKSSDARAHHAVMASRSGFQIGAREVAAKHNLTLLHVAEQEEVDISIFGAHWSGTTDMLHIDWIELNYVDGEAKRLPQVAHAMTYYAYHTILQWGSVKRSLDDILSRQLGAFAQGGRGRFFEHIVSAPAGTRVLEPDDGEMPLKSLASIRFCAGVIEGKVLTGPASIDLSTIAPDVTVQNLTSGEKRTFLRRDLRLGLDNAFKEGSFYEQPNFPAYYYCDQIRGRLAQIYLVESFQHGHLVQATLTVDVVHANYYVPVSDPEVLKRLQRRLKFSRQNDLEHH